MKALVVGLMALALISSCTSPLDLEVNRDKAYADGSFHPKRLSFYYHFADSAYEAIVVDTTFLNSIWIDQTEPFFEVTIPEFVFQLPQTIEPTLEHTPFVSTLCFASNEQPADGLYRLCINSNSWMEGAYIDQFGIMVPFRWPNPWYADDQGRQIRLAYYQLPRERLIKGSMQIALTDPATARFVTYRALITMEY